MIHCLIPAKDNSKRIRLKNIRPFLGIPIINITINRCLFSNVFKSIDVFTNSNLIKNKVGILGDKIKIVKENNNLSENRTTSDLLLDYIKIKGIKDGKIALIYPTSVFVDDYDIKAICKIKTKKTVVACKKIDKKAFNAYANGKRISNTYKNTISQLIPQPYVDAGQFYLIDVETFLKDPVILSDEIAVYGLPRESIDIDEPEDWIKAENLFDKQLLEEFKA
jgi:CMP-N-acetylneuraminic acid synthetase